MDRNVVILASLVYLRRGAVQATLSSQRPAIVISLVFPMERQMRSRKDSALLTNDFRRLAPKKSSLVDCGGCLRFELVLEEARGGHWLW